MINKEKRICRLEDNLRYLKDLKERSKSLSFPYYVMFIKEIDIDKEIEIIEQELQKRKEESRRKWA